MVVLALSAAGCGESATGVASTTSNGAQDASPDSATSDASGVGSDGTREADAGPNTDAAPGTDAGPNADADSSTDAGPNTDADSGTDAGPNTDADSTAPDSAQVDAAGDVTAFADVNVADVDDSPDTSTDVAPDIATDTAPDVSPPPPPPQLASLSLQGAVLNVPFAPNVHDYTVACTAGANTWQVAVQPDAEATLSLLAPQPLASLPAALTVTMQENDALVIRATNTAGATTDYWVRCLPHDFPVLTMPSAPTTPSVPAANDGWYLLGNTLVAKDNAGFAMVLDARGTPVWYHRTDVGGCFVDSFAPNQLAYAGAMGKMFGTDPNGHFVVHDLATDTTLSVATATGPTDHHELFPLQNGNSLVLSYPLNTAIDLANLGVTPTTPVADCVIEEIAPSGKSVWQWTASEHIDVATESNDLLQTQVDGKTVIDAYHCNSLGVDANGDIALSVRHMDAVYLISRKSGLVQWKLGGTPTNKDGAALLTVQGVPFYHQHMARFLPNGHLTLFDNHSGQDGVARGLELALDVPTGKATIVWQYADSINSYAMGSFHVAFDGSRVIGWGFPNTKGPHVAMTEVDAAGNVLRTLSLPEGDLAYRVLKVAPSQLDIALLRKLAGK